MMGVLLYKFELWRLGSEYDAILFSDLDVDLYPPLPIAPDPNLVARAWGKQLRRVVSLARRRSLHIAGL